MNIMINIRNLKNISNIKEYKVYLQYNTNNVKSEFDMLDLALSNNIPELRAISYKFKH